MTGRFSRLHFFVTYRRADSAPYAGRLHDALVDQFGEDKVFQDVSGIDPGEDFEVAIDAALDQAAAVLVLIGPNWLAPAADGLPRLHDPHDYVRIEVSKSLARNIPVVPILVGGAALPSAAELPADLVPLTRRQAVVLQDNDWQNDVEGLIERLRGETRTKGRLAWVAAAGLVLVATLGTWAILADGDQGSQVTTSAVTTVATSAVTTVATTAADSVPIATDPGGGPEEIVQQAESGDIESPMSSVSDESASGGQFVLANQGTGKVDFTFNVEGGDYVVWARAAAGTDDPDDPLRHDSFLVALDGGSSDIWDLFEATDIPPTDWTWDKVSLRCSGDEDTHLCNPMILPLAPGEHTLSVLAREKGSKVDVIVITDALNSPHPEIED